MARRTGGRLDYADLLRVLAILAFLTLQISHGWLTTLPYGRGDWHALHVWDALSRWAVPVFVMCSGMFLLDPKKKVSYLDLFVRYLLRMVVALLFWSVIYHVFIQFLQGNLPIRFSTLWPILWGDYADHLKYLVLAFGLYLLTPALRAFVRGAKRSDFHWFFLLYFLFVGLIPLWLRLYGSEPLTHYANRLYLNFALIYPPLGYVGYYVAGYYLKEYTLNRLAEAIIYLCGIAGGVVTIWLSINLNARQSAFQFNGTLLNPLTPNVMAMSVAIFVLFRYVLGLSDERSRRQRAHRVARYTFGIYLSHYLVLLVLQHFGLTTPGIPAAIAVPLLVAVLFLPSFALSWLLNHIPFVGRYIA